MAVVVPKECLQMKEYMRFQWFTAKQQLCTAIINIMYDFWGNNSASKQYFN